MFTGTAALKASACLAYIFHELLLFARCYPEGFAKNLPTLFQGRRSFPMHLRHKQKVDLGQTDRQLFEAMSVGDLWVDAGMVDVWTYIYKSKHVNVPESWRLTIDRFNCDVVATVPGPGRTKCQKLEAAVLRDI